jgi:hypothetical protein
MFFIPQEGKWGARSRKAKRPREQGAPWAGPDSARGRVWRQLRVRDYGLTQVPPLHLRLPQQSVFTLQLALWGLQQKLLEPSPCT